MKKNVVKDLFVLILGIFMLIPNTVNASLEKEWKYDIDLSNSLSSSIVKLEDGVAVMNYEGTASSNNTIIKLSYDAKLINSIKNDYGYSMAEYDGGLLVYSEGSYEITKLDKDLNVVWTVSSNIRSSDIVDLNEGFASIGRLAGPRGSTALNIYDDSGNVTSSKTIEDIIKSAFDSNANYACSSVKINKSFDGENIILFLEMTAIAEGYNSGVGIIVLSKQLEVVSSYKEDLEEYDLYEFNGVSDVGEKYILSGFKTVVMSKDGKIEKKLNTTTFDVTYLNKNVYAYTLNPNDLAYSYDSSFSKYTSDFELIGSRKLPLSFEMTDTGGATGISIIKKRAIFYEKDNDVKVIVLNTPIVVSDEKGSGNCTVTQYRVGDFTDDGSDDTTNNNSGIINNITKNPQTNSVAVVIVFIGIIAVVSGGYYFLYKRRSINKK